MLQLISVLTIWNQSSQHRENYPPSLTGYRELSSQDFLPILSKRELFFFLGKLLTSSHHLTPQWPPNPSVHIWSLSSVFYKLGLHLCWEREIKNRRPICVLIVSSFTKPDKTKPADRDIFSRKNLEEEVKQDVNQSQPKMRKTRRIYPRRLTLIIFCPHLFFVA